LRHIRTVVSEHGQDPKKGRRPHAQILKLDGGRVYDEAELEAYRNYLIEPWPLPKPGVRPTIPKAIRDDVNEESHHGCAICGHMDNGEIAHIEAVAKTLNNAPATSSISVPITPVQSPSPRGAAMHKPLHRDCL
jgi:hypothetical protein